MNPRDDLRRSANPAAIRAAINKEREDAEAAREFAVPWVAASQTPAHRLRVCDADEELLRTAEAWLDAGQPLEGAAGILLANLARRYGIEA